MAVSGVFLLVITKLNVSLLIIAGFLALNLSEEQRKNEYVVMQELLYTKDKLVKKGHMPARCIGALSSLSVKELFKMLSYDSYYFIFEMNEQNETIRVVTEAQLVASILQKGWQIRLCDI